MSAGENAKRVGVERFDLPDGRRLYIFADTDPDVRARQLAAFPEAVQVRWDAPTPACAADREPYRIGLS